MTFNDLLNEMKSMNKSGKLPSKERLLEQFRHGPYLYQTLQWFHFFLKYCDYAFSEAKEYNCLEKYPFHSVVFSHLQRIRRYTIGITRLSFPNGPGLFHCIDCYYPILKSVFELMVEFRLAVSYLDHFGDTPVTRKAIADRIIDYADLDKKQKNYRFFYMDYRFEFEDAFKPKDIRDYENAGKKHADNQRKIIGKKLDKGLAKDIKHWYPTKDREGKDIGKRSIGSMEWRCKDVLGAYAPTEMERVFWTRNYDTTYSLLNRYSHPVLGYDDNLRDQIDRLLDLFLILFPFLTLLNTYFISEVNNIFCVRIENNQDLIGFWLEAEEHHKELGRYYSCLSLALNMQS